MPRAESGRRTLSTCWQVSVDDGAKAGISTLLVQLFQMALKIDQREGSSFENHKGSALSAGRGLECALIKTIFWSSIAASQHHSSMLGKGKERPGVSAAPESPSLDVRLLSESSGGLLDMGDDSGFMNLTSKDLDKMNLVDTPPVRRIEKKSRMSLTSPSKTKQGGRPSWGPKSSPTKGKLRLFEGLEKDVASTSGPPQVKRKERTLGGFGQDKGSTMRPRQSMFAKPSVVQSRQSLGQEEADINDKEEEGEDSFYKNPTLSSSTGSVKDRVAAIEASRLQADSRSYTNGAESKEQMDNQLAELRKINDVFEAYEGMLTASADQIEVCI